MTKKYQFRVEVGAFEFVFAVGAEALSFVRSAVEHFSPDKYYNEVPIRIGVERIPEPEPKQENPDRSEEEMDD